MSINLNNSDYLVKSGVLDKAQLSEDTVESYKGMLEDKDTDPTYHKLISNFLLPYRISFFKFIFNKDYYREVVDKSERTRRQIAPSLVKLMDDPTCRANGYPHWFYIAFPDVALWAMIGNGNSILKQEFAKLPMEKIIENGGFSIPFLKMIIELYKQDTNNRLECEMYQ